MRVLTRAASPAALALAAALGVGLAGAHGAAADPSLQSPDNGPRLTLLSPAAHAAFHGVKPIEIDALYEGSADNQIVSLDLYIDGVKAQSQTLDSPELKGMVSFLVDSSLMTPGTHYVVVRATAADAEVRSVRGAFVYQADAVDISPTPNTSGDPTALAWPSSPGDAPQMRLMSPAPDSRVEGTVRIKVDASDASGKPPYVSIFVDGEMKQLVNYRPFEYDWDTSALSNGWHTIAIVEAFDDDAAPVAHIKPIRVYVNNPGGQTHIRTDLLDGQPAVRPALAPPIAAVPVVQPAPRKTLTPRAVVRRPRGEALLSVPALPALHPQAAHHALIAEMNPRWDVSAAPLTPALSAPMIPAMPKMPTTGFKPLPTASHRLRPLGTPLTADLPSDAPKHSLRASASAPTLLAQAGPLDDTLAAPLLALPDLPAAAPAHVKAVTPRADAPKNVLRLAIPEPRLLPMRLRTEMPALSLHRPASVRPHVAISGASLLRTVGEERVQFNNKTVVLERPLAVQQDVLFGPLRRIFEYGGGSLQWDAHAGVVRARTATRDMRLTIGERQATVNRQPFLLDGAPYVSAGRTMVPLSFVGEALDANVQYDPATGHLRITSRH